MGGRQEGKRGRMGRDGHGARWIGSFLVWRREGG